MNSVNINLYGYYSNFANLHIFSLTNLSDFESWKGKIEEFFYLAFSITSALSDKI